MKELSIEEKAKAYDKAIEFAHNKHRFSSNLSEIKLIEEIFPELKESEGEKIRKQVMSQMPDKIWLHKDTKYSTGDIVCGYQYDFAQGIEDEGGIENFVEYVPADSFFEKAADWLNNFYNEDTHSYLINEDIEKFINYMKGE